MAATAAAGEAGESEKNLYFIRRQSETQLGQFHFAFILKYPGDPLLPSVIK
jgi:hypothetical protein